ncbi:hypothetical protein GQ85_04375 [Rhodococcus rhodochrous]|nr:hypothetical protein GQ85_04375 [Rhodococcus rhodochrous]
MQTTFAKSPSFASSRRDDEWDVDPGDLLRRSQLVHRLVVEVRAKRTTQCRMMFMGVDPLFRDDYFVITEGGHTCIEQGACCCTANHCGPETVCKCADELLVHLLQGLGVSRCVVGADYQE